MRSIPPHQQQVLVALLNVAGRDALPNRSDIEQAGKDHFCGYKLDWENAFGRLCETGAIRIEGDTYTLTEKSTDLAIRLRSRHPRYRYWYNEWYTRGLRSKAHRSLCEEVFGTDLCQTGMATVSQLDALAEHGLVRGGVFLDLGCGPGERFLFSILQRYNNGTFYD